MFNCKRTIISLCVLLCSIGAWMTPVQAAPQKVTLTVDYVYDGTAIKGADVDIYLVATKVAGKYELTSQFETLDVKFDQLGTLTSWSDEGEVIDTYITDNKCVADGSQTTNASGNAVFNKLEEGIYFVDVEDVDYKEGTLLSNPVIVTVPLYNNETNEFTYAVEMKPKVDFKEKPEPSEPAPSETPAPSEPKPSETPAPSKPKPSQTPAPSEPEPTETPAPSESAPTETPAPSTTAPTETPTTSDPDDLIDVGDHDVPLTGTWAWLIAPLAVVGFALFVYGLFGLNKKEESK